MTTRPLQLSIAVAEGEENVEPSLISHTTTEALVVNDALPVRLVCRTRGASVSWLDVTDSEKPMPVVDGDEYLVHVLSQ